MLQLDVKLLAAGAYSLEELTSREDILRRIFEGDRPSWTWRNDE